MLSVLRCSRASSRRPLRRAPPKHASSLARLPVGLSKFSSKTNVTPTKDDDVGVEATSSQGGVFTFADHTLRGIGQVVFANSSKSGAALLAFLTAVDPFLGSLSLLGAVSATATAKAMGVNEEAVSSGLLGYNGTLVGAVFSVFLPSTLPVAAAALAVSSGAAASAGVYVALGKIITKVPQYTLAFNMVALSALSIVRPLDVPAAAAASVPGLTDWALAPLAGLSQILVLDSPIAGLAVLGAIGLGGLESREGLPDAGRAIGAALMGSTVGCVTAAMIGADPSAICSGLHGFNPALTTLAVATFFKPTPAAAALAASGAAATTVAAAGLSTALTASAGVPCLTVPFCGVASLCYLLAQPGGAKGLALKDP